MIFMTLGSQKFQFNRLLSKVDDLVSQGMITEEVFAQTGHSDYVPRHYEYKKFLDRDEFAQTIKLADMIITHGGTGAIIGAIKSGKKVIVVPRLAKFGEHVDDHQLQIIAQFSEMQLLCECNDCDDLGGVIVKARNATYKVYQSNTSTIINALERYLEAIK